MGRADRRRRRPQCFGTGATADKSPNALAIGYLGGSQGTLNVRNGGRINLGLEPGANQYAQLFAGYGGGGSEINLDNGSINLGTHGASIRIGLGNGAVLNMSNGAVIDSSQGASHFWLGEWTGRKAVANVDNSAIIIRGGGTNTAKDERLFVIGYDGGAGEFNQSGDNSYVHVSGIHRVGIGNGNGASGVYNLNGGLLEVGREETRDSFWIGAVYGEGKRNAATAVFNVNGGAAHIHGNLEIGSAGVAGYMPDATVNINGGRVTVGGRVNFGPDNGRLNLYGGALELAGSNAITGSGELTLAGGVIRATGDLGVAHAATLAGTGATFDSNGHAITWSGAISGDGGLVKQGEGALILSGANAYTGGTTISGGQVVAQHATALGSGPVRLENGTLRLAAENVAPGEIVAAGAGGIDLNGYDLTLANGGSGSGAVSFVNNGATPATVTLASSLSWSGVTSLSGDLTLATTASNQLSARSVLDVGAASRVEIAHDQTVAGLTGAGAVALAAGAVFSVAAGEASLTFDGVISGAGGLRKAGEGQVTLTAAQTYAGDTTVESGVLALSGDGRLGAGRLALRGGVVELEQSAAFASITGILADGGAIRAAGDISLGQDIAIASAGHFDSNGRAITLSGAISGDGGLVKQGDGALILSGANAYAGGTTISGGQVVAQHAAALGSGPVRLERGTLQLAAENVTPGEIVAAGAGGIDLNGYDLTLAGGGSGSGAVSFVNSGAAPATVTLASAIGWQGTTGVGAGVTLHATGAGQLPAASTVSIDAGGALRADASQTLGGLAGAGDVTLGGAGDVELAVGANNADTTFGGVISGAGSLRKVGAGQLTLTAAQTFRGSAVVDSGVLALAGAGGFDDATAFVLNGGVLDLGGRTQKASAVQLSGGALRNGALDSGLFEASEGVVAVDLVGDGAFVKTGPGLTVLTGDNSAFSGTVTVAAGELAGPVAAFGAGGLITVNAGATVTFSQPGAGVWSGAIVGDGDLKVTGGGEIEITGAGNTFTGSATVEGATLRVNGALPNATVIVATDGRVSGSGVVGGLVVAGVAAPGNSPGTLVVSGDARFVSGSAYEVEVNAAGVSDRIAVSGVATIEGGVVAVLADQGNYARRTRYVILSADGGVAGQFDGVTSNMAFLTPSLQYDSASVTLQLDRNDLAFGQTAWTASQFAVATAVERLGYGNPLYDAILFTSAGQARAGFDMMSGEIHAAWTTTAFTEAGLVRDALLGRLRAAHGEGAAAAGQATVPAGKTGSGATFWGQGVGSWGEARASHGLASVDRRSGGFILGADADLGGVTAGVAGGYLDGRFDMDARLSRASSQTVFGALYAGASLGQMQLSAGASYAGARVSTQRGVAFAGYADYATAKYDARVFQAFGEIAYRLPLSETAAASPFVNVAGLRVSTDGFLEHGGAAALGGRSRTDSIGVTTAGVRFDLRAGGATLNGMIGWRGAFGDVRPTALNAFRGNLAAPFAVSSAPVDRSALAVAAGVDWAVAAGVKLGVSYNGQYGAHNADQQFRAHAEIRF
ncbi:autotransporter domain-containing protein [Camelimonas abortus]|uniref:Autotransporter domain-containing protein n=1 Tax=Camelimonas abortus TaxID=1017184 RepID=A0ABV7LAR8_9HYPH